MTKLAEEAAKLIDSLPPEKARALLDYARYLAEHVDEEDWDHQFSDPKYAKKFGALLAEVDREIAQGKTEPFDPSRL